MKCYEAALWICACFVDMRAVMLVKQRQACFSRGICVQKRIKLHLDSISGNGGVVLLNQPSHRKQL